MYKCEVEISAFRLNNDTTTTFTDDDCNSDATMDLEIVSGSDSPKKENDKNISQRTRKKNTNTPKTQKKESAKIVAGNVKCLILLSVCLAFIIIDEHMWIDFYIKLAKRTEKEIKISTCNHILYTIYFITCFVNTKFKQTLQTSVV